MKLLVMGAVVVASALGVFLVRSWSPCPLFFRQPVSAQVNLVSGSDGTFTHRESGVVLVRVPEGQFLRGAGNDDVEAREWIERPQHHVSIRAPFFLARTELTRGQWYKVMGWYPADPCAGGIGDDHPVHGLTIREIKPFLSKSGFRLPTEDEWEYAARAGTLSPRYGSIDRIAWHNENPAVPVGAEEAWKRWDYTKPPKAIATKEPNPLGLYDMYGNVSEYVGTLVFEYHSDAEQPRWVVEFPGTCLHVIRGGSVASPSEACRASWREWLGSDEPTLVGFRVACDSGR